MELASFTKRIPAHRTRIPNLPKAFTGPAFVKPTQGQGVVTKLSIPGKWVKSRANYSPGFKSMFERCYESVLPEFSCLLFDFCLFYSGVARAESAFT
ncbi:hypothetical protein ACFS7Z_20280 [Pontibacter toksunensis]|uniref:Uncharacterized protein n=1 Tax=Pontibacter toksunensis TaxID=1332631 RepID=A0ABW6BY39_9BACT